MKPWQVTTDDIAEVPPEVIEAYGIESLKYSEKHGGVWIKVDDLTYPLFAPIGRWLMWTGSTTVVVEDPEVGIRSWRVMPVAELDATADKCLIFFEGTDERMCRHESGDPRCKATQLQQRTEREAAAAVQTGLFGVEP